MVFRTILSCDLALILFCISWDLNASLSTGDLDLIVIQCIKRLGTQDKMVFIHRRFAGLMNILGLFLNNEKVKTIKKSKKKQDRNPALDRKGG